VPLLSSSRPPTTETIFDLRAFLTSGNAVTVPPRDASMSRFEIREIRPYVA
jgi:hypothetical protein